MSFSNASACKRSNIVSIERETELFLTNWYSLKSASKTGLVIMCCANISIASSWVIEGLRFFWSDLTNSSISCLYSPDSTSLLIRAINWRAIAPISFAQFSQYMRSPTFSTNLAYILSSILPKRSSNWVSNVSGSIAILPIPAPPTTIFFFLSLLRLIWLTWALKRSSCERSALRIDQTVLKSFASSTVPGSASVGITTGIMI